MAGCPQDLVAIFHASFHPTQGNVVDWSVKASEDLNLEHLEFSALPSGLHLVNQDVIYFTKNGHHGVCVFRKRKSSEEGHRGFRLSSLGILLAKSKRPRAWKYVQSLKDLIDNIYSKVEQSGSMQPAERDWQQARVYFEERKVRRADLGGAGDWNGWSKELDGALQEREDSNPVLHLPHLLRILGPSSLTLYKFVLGRRRILIYTLPPVEAACILCQVAADMCYEYQTNSDDPHSSDIGAKLKGRTKDSNHVLGMVTLNDMDRLIAEGQSGKGWIACTTDAIFLERPSCYDLLIDLTTSTPNKSTRPTFHCSKPVNSLSGSSRAPTHRLSTIRFSWSDVKLWNEVYRILQLDSDQATHHACCGPPESTGRSIWTDAWRVYEDVCVVCASLWIGSWRGNSTLSYSTANGPENWGAVHLEGDDDLTHGGAYVRNVGMGIEGGPKTSLSGGIGNTVPILSSQRRVSSTSWFSGRTSIKATSNPLTDGKPRQADIPDVAQHSTREERERRDCQLLTTLALLQTFHAHTSFQLSVLKSFLPLEKPLNGELATVYLSPKEIVAFELSPMSSVDARYLEWLAQEYAGGVLVVVRRGWKDLLNAIFGY